MKKTDEIQLADLHLDSQSAIDALYRKHRDEFVQFGKRYLRSEEDIIDIYQDAVIALFEKVQAGKLTSLRSSVKTYLFSIGKFLMIDKHKSNIRVQSGIDDRFPLADIEVTDHAVLSERSAHLYHALSRLGETCRNILTYYYYRNFDLESIAIALDYKNSNVVKSHKSRCMQRLREIYKKMS